MPKIEVNLDGVTIEATEGETILEAATREGVDIPTLCNDTRLDPAGACRTCLVEVEGQRVLLFKSNTHLTWPGTRYLEELINRFVDYAEPSVIFSIGTAGGLRL